MFTRTGRPYARLRCRTRIRGICPEHCRGVSCAPMPFFRPPPEPRRRNCHRRRRQEGESCPWSRLRGSVVVCPCASSCRRPRCLVAGAFHWTWTIRDHAATSGGVGVDCDDWAGLFTWATRQRRPDGEDASKRGTVWSGRAVFDGGWWRRDVGESMTARVAFFTSSG